MTSRILPQGEPRQDSENRTYTTLKADKNSAGDSTKQLKFGVDRILSDEISTWRCPKKSTTVSDSENGSLPCSECVSSLWRCCQLNETHGSVDQRTLFYAASLPHALQLRHPTKTFSNLVLDNETHREGSIGKRKRSWSRAVFSSLQRKGLEKRFQVQKYITKPDRRQLAATLGLTDAQVKVWFQNRRMKWRHCKELKKEMHK